MVPLLGVELVNVRGGSFDSGPRKLRLDSFVPQSFNKYDPRTGFRCIIPASDLDKIATDYQVSPFARLYGLYGSPEMYFPTNFYSVYQAFGFYGTFAYIPYRVNPYQSWWYSVYLRYLQDQQYRQNEKQGK